MKLRTLRPALLAILGATGSALAAPGEVDTRFGTNGSLNLPTCASAMARDQAGQIWVACGTGATLHRYSADGKGNGQWQLPFQVRALAVDYAGRVVVSGGNPAPEAPVQLTRLLGDGRTDTTFGNRGIATLPHDRYPIALESWPDGSLNLGAASWWGRMTEAGSLDPAFGTQGVVEVLPHQQRGLVPLPGGATLSIQEQDTGLFGQMHIQTLRRMDRHGNREDGFGVNGVVEVPLHSRLLPLPDGRLLAIDNHALKLLDVDGRTVTQYGTNGVAELPATAGSTVQGLRQPDGKVLLLTAVNGTGGSTLYRLVRVNADGTPDDGSLRDSSAGDRFGQLGYADLPALQDAVGGDTQFESFFNLSLDPRGRVVIAGVKWEQPIATAVQTEAFDVTPDKFGFLERRDVVLGSEQRSELVTVAGLGQGVEVIATAVNGEIAKNGASVYQPYVWVKNGDQIGVRHTAAATEGAVVETRVRIGGVSEVNNPATLWGPTEAVFRSATVGAPKSGGGGGALDLALLGLLALFGLKGRRR